MNLSKNFTLSEMTATDTGYINKPGQQDIDNLFILANYVAQPIRDAFGPIRVISGFRNRHVNRRVGGRTNSQHLSGCAVDILPLEADIELVFSWIKRHVVYGQCIFYRDRNFIHVSLARVTGDNGQSWIEVEK